MQEPMTRAAKIERLLAWTLCLLAVAGTAFRHLGRWHWTFELTTHFVVQASLLAAGAALLLGLRGHRRLAFVAALMALVNAAEWMPYFSGAPTAAHATSSRTPLVVVAANVHSNNRQVAALDRWLVDADVVFLSEVDPWWAHQLAAWRADWPHQIVHPRRDNFGLALLSRHPIVDSEVFELEGEDPAISARIRTASGLVTIVGLHPFPPAGGTYSTYRNLQLSAAAKRIESLPAPRIVLGDLNTTSSSPFFRDLLATTGLRDTRPGFGWQATWPASSWLLRIPIDHVLVEPSLIVRDRRVGPDIGSDHLPVRVELEITTRPTPPQSPSGNANAT